MFLRKYFFILVHRKKSNDKNSKLFLFLFFKILFFEFLFFEIIFKSVIYSFFLNNKNCVLFF